MAGSAHASMNMECDGSINLGRKGTWKGERSPLQHEPVSPLARSREREPAAAAPSLPAVDVAF
jgi:hypothetical protein